MQVKMQFPFVVVSHDLNLNDGFEESSDANLVIKFCHKELQVEWMGYTYQIYVILAR